MSTLKLVARFEEPGAWMYHCHIPEHAEGEGDLTRYVERYVCHTVDRHVCDVRPCLAHP